MEQTNKQKSSKPKWKFLWITLPEIKYQIKYLGLSDF